MAAVRDDVLTLPADLIGEATQWAEQDGIPLEQFVVQAVIEKIAALKDRRYFEERRRRADPEAFARILAKAGTEPPRPDDLVPSDW